MGSLLEVEAHRALEPVMYSFRVLGYPLGLESSRSLCLAYFRVALFGVGLLARVGYVTVLNQLTMAKKHPVGPVAEGSFLFALIPHLSLGFRRERKTSKNTFQLIIIPCSQPEEIFRSAGFSFLLRTTLEPMRIIRGTFTRPENLQSKAAIWSLLGSYFNMPSLQSWARNREND
ncbi:uncharacterized protein MYCFIDRAFT_172412 [Pseudocercospora fijiensis CIRAD86]|uniref:Uncharacterized protein n=1 Tax=Pseudocercospora fijiensis (strain CIRAD86) TaxID=383855 RepID=M3A6I8_PSEFD|nr:uncharacterized protein MYCFIDRAFT_172412 [Pseudocercospora fijiensis CIRAD86]EME86714.1 hypothetical protein MYCFIDRAFT_172412 [Pseudocercospora fijiensis CIRAD86]